MTIFNTSDITLTNYFSNRVESDEGIAESLECVSEVLSGYLSKSINYFNRKGTIATDVVFTNEATNVSTNFNVDSLSNTSYYDVLNFTATDGYFNENDFYLFEIKDASGDIIFKDKLFVTNQDISNNLIYDINKNRYKPNTTTNEYTIYE